MPDIVDSDVPFYTFDQCSIPSPAGRFTPTRRPIDRRPTSYPRPPPSVVEAHVSAVRRATASRPVSSEVLGDDVVVVFSVRPLRPARFLTSVSFVVPGPARTRHGRATDRAARPVDRSREGWPVRPAAGEGRVRRGLHRGHRRQTLEQGEWPTTGRTSPGAVSATTTTTTTTTAAPREGDGRQGRADAVGERRPGFANRRAFRRAPGPRTRPSPTVSAEVARWGRLFGFRARVPSVDSRRVGPSPTNRSSRPPPTANEGSRGLVCARLSPRIPVDKSRDFDLDYVARSHSSRRRDAPPTGCETPIDRRRRVPLGGGGHHLPERDSRDVPVEHVCRRISSATTSTALFHRSPRRRQVPTARLPVCTTRPGDGVCREPTRARGSRCLAKNRAPTRRADIELGPWGV